MRTENTRLRRALTRLQDQMRRMRHLSLQDQVNHLNQMLRGHYAYYGIAGNIQALQQVHRAAERYWRKMLSSRSWDGVIRWEQFQRIKEQFPLLRPKLYLPYRELQAIAIRESKSEERSAANPHATFCGSRRRATASGHPVGDQQ